MSDSDDGALCAESREGFMLLAHAQPAAGFYGRRRRDAAILSSSAAHKSQSKLVKSAISFLFRHTFQLAISSIS